MDPVSGAVLGRAAPKASRWRRASGTVCNSSIPTARLQRRARRVWIADHEYEEVFDEDDRYTMLMVLVARPTFGL